MFTRESARETQTQAPNDVGAKLRDLKRRLEDEVEDSRDER